MNRNIINKINNEFNFNLPYDEFIKKVDLNKIKNKNKKKVIVTLFSLFITSLCIIIGFNYSKQSLVNDTVIMPSEIIISNNKYINQGTTYHNKEYLLEIVGYIIKEDDIKEFEKEYPDVEYFSTKNLSNSNFNDRVPIYSLVEYDSSKYLAVLFDSSLYSIYKTEEAEEINLTNMQP